jgi:hypothetical protein
MPHALYEFFHNSFIMNALYFLCLRQNWSVCQSGPLVWDKLARLPFASACDVITDHLNFYKPAFDKNRWVFQFLIRVRRAVSNLPHRFIPP